MSLISEIHKHASADLGRLSGLLGNGPGGNGHGIGPQLGNAFSNTMKGLTSNLFHQQFPGVNFGNGPRPTQGGAPAADARPTLPTPPGGPTLPAPQLPALPGSQPAHGGNGAHSHGGHPAGPNIPTPGGIPAGPGLGGGLPGPARPDGGHAPHLPSPGGPTSTPGQTGLLPALGNLLGNAANAVRQLLSPGTALPPAFQSGPPGGGPVATPQTLPTQLASTANQVVRALTNAVPQTPATAPPGTATNTVALPAAAPGQTAATPAGVAQQPSATPQTLAQQATMPQTASPPPTVPAAPAQAQATSTPLPVPPQAPPAQPQQAGTAPAPPGNPAMDRSAVPQQAAPPTQPAIANAPAGTTLAAVPAAVMATQAPATQQVAGNTQIAGNPQATAPAAGERGGPSRVDLVATGVYTADGPGLRRRNRFKVGPADIGQWMVALAQGRRLLMRPHDDLPAEIARAMQWLFWTLALVAYGCLGLVLVSVLLSMGEMPAAPAMRRWSSELAFAGLAAACGAWWLARRLNAPARGAAGPVRR
ncbi:hypothetical protein BEN78_05435 [Xanthomonas citri pv. mangiferaeindicae]|nr:hypothetical protein BEN78_05435 [Xanthomonas citri pv. mangiferaeindicae]